MPQSVLKWSLLRLKSPARYSSIVGHTLALAMKLLPVPRFAPTFRLLLLINVMRGATLSITPRARAIGVC